MKPNRDFRWRRFLPAQVLTFILLRSLIMVVNMFTYRYIHRIGKLAGRVFHLVDLKHRRIAEKNVERAEGMPKDRRTIRRFVRRVYENMGILAVETLFEPRLIACRAVSRMVTLAGKEKIDACLKEGRGVVLAIPHLGNWEIAGIACSLAGIPVNVIARPIENPWLNDYLTRIRSMPGTRVISKYGAVAAGREVLKANQVLVILADQDARKGGIHVPFFGRPASTVKSPALLALKYGAPLLTAYTYREGHFRHVAVIEDPIPVRGEAGVDEKVRELTAAFTARFERYVRSRPEQYVWLHARWKTKPGDAPGAAESADEEAEPAPAI